MLPAHNLNFRDIGGLEAAGGRTRSGVLFRSEGPRNFSPELLAKLREMGFRSIVDLRSSHERADAPHDWHGAECRWLELDVNADLRVFGNEGRERLMKGAEPEIAISTMAETYREIVGALVPHWPAIATALLDQTGPVLLNCTAGKDRTGVSIALLLELAGVPREVIMGDYMRSSVFGENLKRGDTLATGLMATFGFMPSAEQIDALIGVREDYLEAAWDELSRKWLDVPSYFAAAGLDHTIQRRIRAAMVD